MMMKCIILCVVMAAVLANDVTLPKEQMIKVHEYGTDCMKETGVNVTVINDAKEGRFAEDESFKKFLFCFFKKAEFVDKDGKFNMEASLSKVPPGMDKAEAKKVLEACKDQKGKDSIDTAFEIFKCFHKNSKTHILF